MMKMNENTTLADLQKYLEACDHPFVTMMKGLDGQKHVIMHAPNAGTFHGNGTTVAEALESAFTQFRRATLPEALQIFLDEPTRDEHDDYDAACGLTGVPILGLCHGCGLSRAEHPNDSGCQAWHDKP